MVLWLFSVQVGEKGVVRSRSGVKVETGRALESAAGRGFFARVERNGIVRGCLRLVLDFRVKWRKCLLSGLWQIFDRSGVRGEHVAS